MKSVKYFFALLATILCLMHSNAQSASFSLEFDNLTCHYTIVNGRMTGDYSSFYRNGVKRCEGQLLNGYRKGKWTVWDSAGRKKMERFYKSPFEFERIFPLIPNEGPIPLLATNQYPMQYDSNNIFKYTHVSIEDAVWRHKYWRILLPEQNNILFDKKRLLKIFCELVKQEKTEVYSTVDDRFTTTISIDTFDIRQAEFIGLNLKEEGIFDMNRLLFEYRILGFSPIVKYKGFEGPIFWIYYPDIRKYLGKEMVVSNNPLIKTVDDLFIFRDFGSSITKTTSNNPMNLPLNEYPNFTKADEIKQASIEELNIIEQENNLWISLSQ